MFAYQTESPAHFNVDFLPGVNVRPPHGLVPSNHSYASSLYDLAGYGKGEVAAYSILISMPLSECLSNLFYLLGTKVLIYLLVL
jgi:hypothetical protein